jgi:hypothetical protein
MCFIDHSSANSKWDGTILYVKNSVLAPQYILNVSRSGPMGETVGKSIALVTIPAHSPIISILIIYLF